MSGSTLWAKRPTTSWVKVVFWLLASRSRLGHRAFRASRQAPHIWAKHAIDKASERPPLPASATPVRRITIRPTPAAYTQVEDARAKPQTVDLYATLSSAAR